MESVIDIDTLRPILGANVRRVRIERGMTQQQLADRIGVREQHVNRIERGKASVSAEVLFAIADALGVSSDTLRQIS